MVARVMGWDSSRCGGGQGLATVAVVIWIGLVGSSTPAEAAKIASATSIPDVTLPMIW